MNLIIIIFFCRFNFTNSEEPYFMLDTLDAINAQMATDNDSLTSIIYSMNQKGRSSGALIRELKIGESHKQEGRFLYSFQLYKNV